MGAHWPSTGHSSTRLSIVEAWYPGEQGGTAIADTLAGHNNPAGRLPVTFYKSVDQLPPLTTTECPAEPTRFFHGVPLFPFGYGLSYTTFAYGNVQSSHRTLRAADALSVRVTITNTGDRAGDEVAQLYLQPISKIDVAANCVKRFHAHSIAT